MALPGAYYKYTLLYNWYPSDTPTRGSKRPGGMSETVYSQTAYPANVENLNRLRNARLALLSPQWAEVGFRVSDALHPNLGVRTFQNTYVGGYSTATDIPQMCIKIQGPSLGGNAMRIMLRGLPDDQIEGGVFKGVGAWPGLLNVFLTQLSGNGWSQPVRDLSANTADVVSISNIGIVRLAQPLIGADEDVMIRVLRTVVNKKRRGGPFRIGTFTDSQNFQILGWTYGESKGGKMRIESQVAGVYNGNNMYNNGVCTRKLGRPFFSFRGQARKSA